MILAEPMTMLTDYVLAGVTGWLGWRLWRGRQGQASRSCWALAFAALTLAALLGGTHHGFAPYLGEGVLYLLWKATVLAVGVASFAMLAGSSLAMTNGRVRRVLLALALAKLALYTGWMLFHDRFIYVIVDTGATMLGVAALHAGPALRRGDRASRDVLGAVGVSVLAAGVQASGFGLHRHFNHNDLYHVIQIVAMLLFYRGAAALRDRA